MDPHEEAFVAERPPAGGSVNNTSRRLSSAINGRRVASI